MNLPILDTYTKIIKSIYSCTTIEQINSCDNMITSMNMHNDRPDLHVWIQAIDKEYMSKRNEIMSILAKSNQVPMLTSMHGEYHEPQPTDIS